MGWDPCGIEKMMGMTLLAVREQSDVVHFDCAEGTFTFYHEQDCCESVTLEHLDGLLPDFKPQKILRAEEKTADNEDGTDGHSRPYGDSTTWTFYDIQTEQMDISMRWFGSSNGYYSESVYLKFKGVRDGGE